MRIGRSVEGRAIEAVVIHPSPGAVRSQTPNVLILGGIHGDEPKGVTVAGRLADLLSAHPTAAGHTRWIVLPLVNPDGYNRRRRRNANRVDINRNFPTRDWTPGRRSSRMFGGAAPASEPETKAVIAAIRRWRPTRIVSIHSIDRERYCVNYDGPASAPARAMASCNGYRLARSIGYPTPGSLGTWAGVERSIPTITLELPSHHSPKRCWEENRDALLTLAYR